MDTSQATGVTQSESATRVHEARNARVAAGLEEVARLLHQQGANPFRVQAYRRAAEAVGRLVQPVEEILAAGDADGLEDLRGIGPALARAIQELARTGRLALLDRLRGDADPIATLCTVPGIGPATADRLLHDLGIATLEDLEAAAHDGRLAGVQGFGEKRLAAIRDSLAARLGRLWRPPEGPSSDDVPSVGEILDVDAEYRERAGAGTLRLIAPRRFNPSGAAWLPILHTTRRDRHYTAAYSNTPRAHRLGRTRDWVVIYTDGARGERQYTVVTAQAGPMARRRIVRGRETECERHHLTPGAGRSPAGGAIALPEQMELVHA